MKRLAMDGEREYSLGPTQVTLRIGRIVNNHPDLPSKRLCVRLFAIEPDDPDSGFLVAEKQLPPLDPGAERRGTELTLHPCEIPNGWFVPVIILAEENAKAPSGWAVVDLYRYDAPRFFGPRVSLAGARFVRTEAGIRVTVKEVRNHTEAVIDELRVTLLFSKTLYDGGPVGGLSLGHQSVGGLAPGSSRGPLVWDFAPVESSDEYGYAVLFLEERQSDRWMVRSHACGEIATPDPMVLAEPKAGPVTDPIADLEALVGLHTVKQELKELRAWAAWSQSLKEKGYRGIEERSLHMCFTGSPGTGKTTVARIVGRMLSKHGLLPSDKFREVKREDLVAEFVGQTAPRTSKVIDDALGGVLFIDEAYSLSDPRALGGTGQDYGSEAIATLIPAMEEHRDKLCVIFAGYSQEMARFLDLNPGMKSRVGRVIEFPDYSDDELWEIFRRMVARGPLKFAVEIEPLFRRHMTSLRRIAKRGEFGNAREVRKVYERAQQLLATRMSEKADPSMDEQITLRPQDFSFVSDVAPPVAPVPNDAELFAQLRARFAEEVAKGKVNPENISALQAALNEFERRGLAPDGARQAATSHLEQLRDEIAALTRRNSATRNIAEELLNLAVNPSYGTPPPPEGSRAAELRDLLKPLKRAVMESHAGSGLGQADSEESIELVRQWTDAERRLNEIGDDDAEAFAFERTRLRALTERMRAYLGRKHLLLAEPLWGNPRVIPSTNAVYFAGRIEVRSAVLSACKRLGLEPANPPAGTAAAQANFAQILLANVCLFDMATIPGADQAAVAYSLGIAWTLGKPIVVLTEPGARMPFDVDLPSIELGGDPEARAALLAEAITRACYQAKSSAHSTGSLATMVEELTARFGRSRRSEVKASLETLRAQVEGKTDWCFAVATARQMLRFNGADGTLLLLHPRQPVRYRASDERRLFHVMPFGPEWARKAMGAAREACGKEVTYVRGDQAADPDVIGSLWDELCRASHVLVDLTGFNANVALELGMAHCMGKKKLLVIGQSGTIEGLFREIEKLRLEPYIPGDWVGLSRRIADFVAG